MRAKVFLFFLLVLALAIVACGGGEAEPAPAVEEPDVGEALEEPVEEPTEESMEEPTEEPVEEPAVEPAPETISVGAVIPLTGAFAGGGAQVERGYQMAVEDINEAGGVFVEEYDANIPIELHILDDESNPTNTVSHLESLNTDRAVVAYLGGFGSSLHAAAAAIAESNQVPYIGVAFALWDVHQQGYEYLFSPFPKSPDLSDSFYEMVNAYVPEGERPTRVAIFQEQTDWGIEMGTLWRESAPNHGYEVVVYEEYTPGASDFTDIILRAQEADAQTVLALPTPPDGFAIYRQMGELGYAPALSYFIRAPDVPTWLDLGGVGDYVILSPGWHNAVRFPGVDELNAKHVELMGRPSDPIVGPSYAAVQILADAIERAGSLDRQAIRDAIAATDMETVAGPITFRDDGTAVITPIYLQYQGEQIQLIWPQEFATADLVYPAPPYDQR